MKRAALLALIGPLCLLGLSGCGFTPLYATHGTGADLAAIDIRPPTDITNYRGTIEDRTSFLLKQSLTDELKLHAHETARYALDTQITERRIPRGVRVNNVANRYEINMTVAYVLTDLVSGKPVLKGSAPVIVDYDSADPPYAGTVAAQDGDQRAAEQAAIAIRIALARYFAGRPESGPGLTQTPLPNNPDNDTP